MDYAKIIKEHVTSREMLEGMGVAVDQRGMANCPFHGEKTASLKVYRDPARGWHCFGCGRGGSVIDLVMLECGLSFRAAMEKINEDYALGLPIGKPAGRAERRRIAQEIRARQEARRRKEAALKAAEEAYWAAYDAWLMNERIIAEQAPEGPLDEIGEAFADAITHKDEIKEALDAAEAAYRAARAAG